MSEEFNLEKLKEHNQILEQEALNIAAEKPKQRVKQGYIQRTEYPLYKLAIEITEIANQLFNAGLTPADINFAGVPDNFEADIALRIPALMKDIRKYSTEILPELQKALTTNKTKLGLTEIQLVPPYLNLTIDYTAFALDTIQSVHQLQNRYGETDNNKNQQIIVEYSSPNVAKTMHIGHLRSTIIGQVLANIYEKTGYTVFRLNHLGDWGTQFGKVATAYRMWPAKYGSLEDQKNPVEFLSRLYADFNQAAKENDDLNQQARDAFADLEKGDADMLTIWKKFYDFSMIEMERMYERMDIDFDCYLGESFYEDKLQWIIDELIKKGIAYKEGRAVVVDLARKNPEMEKVPTFLLVKSDGGTNYAARDLAAFYYRKQYFKPRFAVYVVGSEQSLHLKQIFETMRQLGYLEEGEAIHVRFGQIKESGKKISSREGAGGLEDLLNLIVETVYQNMQEGREDFTEKEKKEIAEQVGIAALFYNDLQNSPEHDVNFDLQKIISTQGKSGPYLQYSIVRGKSILKKAGDLANLKNIDWSEADKLQKVEKKLLLKIAEFPEIIENCVKAASSHHLANYLYDLAQIFNNFHGEIHVINSPENLKEIRKFLVASSVQTLENGLKILNIPIPEKM